VAIVGTTASGKSALAMAAASRNGDVQLVSVDSMQVYRGMDIGTAKPSRADRVAVPHHCIDLVDPTHDFTVAEFQVEYRAAIERIGVARGRAVLVGGTGLYHRVVIDDFDLPGQWPTVRAELESEPDTLKLHRRLAALDPPAANRMEPTNRRRVVRALEVTLGSGRPFSDFGPGVDAYPSSDVVQIGLRRPRGLVAELIARRVDAMMRAGLLDEVDRLRRCGLSRSAAQALGYKELIGYLEGDLGKDEAIAMITTRTRQFAVRQERWFGRDPRVRWVDIEHDPVIEALPTVLAALDAPS
jgi:tRNA dimethylallyltransferase